MQQASRAAITAVVLSTAASGGRGDWTVVASFPIPEGASGLAFDGTDLYCGIYGADGGRVYRIDRETGAFASVFTGDHEDAFGLTFDGTNLWTTDHPGSSSTPAQAMQLDWSGNTIATIDLPDHYMSGIAWDNGTFWVARYYEDPGHLYQVDAAGQVLHEFDFADDQPWDIAVHDDTLWVADYWGDTLYQLDPSSGDVLSSHASQGIDPAGVVWDGTHLWYCDNGDNWDEDRIYKVDLGGGGTPAIELPDASHVFGHVALGDTASWELEVANTGTADLTLTSVAFEPLLGLACAEFFPVVVPIGQTRHLTINWSPTAFAALDTTATVHSNDPVHPAEPVQLTGHAVFPDPTMHVVDDAHDFGSVRTGARTRWFIDITNQGASSLVITSATSDSTQFTVDSGVSFPLTIDTLTSTRIGIWFAPLEATSHDGSIVISSNAGEAAVTVTGTGDDADLPLGTGLWSYTITGGWDNTAKAMAPIEDIDGDDRHDLIVCSEDGYVRCFNGNAHGTGDVLWAHEVYSGPVYSRKGLDIVHDIDGDGIDDIVIGTTGGARLVRMLSGRTGTEMWSFHTNHVGDGGWVYQVDGSRDFTSDGVRDVLACAGDDGDDTGPNRAYCLDGLDGTIVWQRPLGGPVFAIRAVEDFTDDGVPDAVAGASDEWELHGRGVGIDGATGQDVWEYPVVGAAVWGIVPLGDITADGVDDVCIGDLYSGTMHGVDAVDGQEVWTATGMSWLTGIQVIGDVDGDGHADLVPEHFNDFARVLSGRTGTAVWTTSVVDNPSVAARIPDVSGDGLDDVVIGTLFSNNRLYVFDGADGEILHETVHASALDSVTTMPDVTGDGSWEIVAGERDGLIACTSGGLNAVAHEPADVNGDGVVNVNDILMVIEHWGSTDSPADADGDGIVGVNDILLVIASWTLDP